MKREELIAQLELLPEGAEVYVLMKKGRISEPHMCIYSVNPYPAPEKLVAYIETFYDNIVDRFDDETQEKMEELFKGLTEPCHEHLFHVCHHGRDMMGTCGGCFTEEEEADLEGDEGDW